MTTQEFNEIRKNLDQFRSLDNARAYVARAKKIMMILMGDDGTYWVGLPRYTEKLYRAGYEYAA